MIRHTHTDAKPAQWSVPQEASRPNARTEAMLKERADQWHEMTVHLPSAGLDHTTLRQKGKTLTVTAKRSAESTPACGIDRVTTRIHLHDRPGGPVRAMRRPGSDLVVIGIPHAGTRSTSGLDGLGAVAADRLAEARAVTRNPLHQPTQDTDVFPL